MGGVDCRPTREVTDTAPAAAQLPMVAHDHNDDDMSSARSHHDSDDSFDPVAELGHEVPAPVEEHCTPVFAATQQTQNTTPPPPSDSASARRRLQRFAGKVKKPQATPIQQLPSPEKNVATPWPQMPT